MEATKMLLTVDQLVAIFPRCRPAASTYVNVLNDAMRRNEINTPKRMAAFLAQAGHESAQFTAVVESLNYSSTALLATWPKRFTRELAEKVQRNPEAIANIVYGGRYGNNTSGDGWLYRGRGWFQVTFKNNYLACGLALGLDLVQFPQKLEEASNAALSAAWYWSTNKLNALADAGNFTKITQVINGGQNGAAEREAFYKTALRVLGA